MPTTKTIAISRITIFIIFFWFGIIKVLGLSPAEGLVKELFSITIQQANLISFESFFKILGVTECLIGILWLIPKWTKLAYLILLVQMLTTFAPLILLPSITWHETFIPTLEGQYILKNICILALSLNIFQNHILKN